ncbi:thioredoxin-like protein [Lipomyces tetrasporus]|uniref:Thioredoxin-like protein n=1 Tax=Lipomyces tetrasporus TaxID=54092 RepID=A0AAD7QS04_9ASCO|nr:thioredoxin-like protein [Lipomyces tetrasporus]KAJ8100422.1 thioredoxin-like protein [Lipomyces tetrasporus]
MQVEVNPNEDTEWNDILRAHGVIPERPPSPSQVIDEAIERAREYQEQHRLSDKSDSELSALEDDANNSSEDEFIAAYRRKRLQELAQLQVQRQKFGRVFPVSKPEYQKEVTEASTECFVLVHLSLQQNLQSKLLGGLFLRAAEKFGEIKFVDIPGSRAIEGYPDRNCPTLLVYKDTNVKKQYVTLRLIGGDGMRMEDLERVLVDIGAVKENDSRLTENTRQKKRDYEDNGYDSEVDRSKGDDHDDEFDE